MLEKVLYYFSALGPIQAVRSPYGGEKNLRIFNTLIVDMNKKMGNRKIILNFYILFI